MQDLVSAYNLGKNLAFYKFAAPEEFIREPVTTTTRPLPAKSIAPPKPAAQPKVQPVSTARDFYGDMQREDAISQGTLLARSVNPQIMQEHNLPYDSVSTYADALRQEEDAYVANNQQDPEARKKIRQQLAERVYGDFAQMPESERIGLDRFRERFLDEMPNNIGYGTTAGLHTTPGHGMHTYYKNTPSIDYRMHDEGMEPLQYSGNFQNPDDPEHRFSPNIIYRKPDLSFYRELESMSPDVLQGYSLKPNLPPLVIHDAEAPSPFMALLGAKPNIVSDKTLMSIPYHFRTEGVTKPNFNRVSTIQEPSIQDIGMGMKMDTSVTDMPYDGFITAHEMYHHKMQNLRRSNPYLNGLLEANMHLDRHSGALNEEFADMYAAQAGRYDYDKLPVDVAAEASPVQDDGLHHPAPIRIRIPQVGPRY